MPDKVVLVTGAAGFIGFHLSQRLVTEGYEVVGIDNLNPYYEISLKEARLRILEKHEGFSFFKMDLKDVGKLFGDFAFNYVVNLAAQAGVRYSIQDPMTYLESNLRGFLCVLEACRHHPVTHLVYASSSSVYGANRHMPFSVHDNVDHPISFYAASKKANELMAHTYSALFNLPTTGLRFFTVYGPYGRPDMALFLFTKAILENRAIDVYNHGKMKRDFTYVDDIVDGIVRVLPRPATPNSAWNANQPDPASSFAPYRVYNIGNNRPVELLRFIEVLENKLGKKAIKNFLPLQEGDVEETYADISDLQADVGFNPITSIDEGIGKFVEWYKAYYRIT